MTNTISMKKRLDIPPTISAQVLFLSDRTCCVCRKKGKYIQIHHLDEKPDNYDINNLAILCLECHTDTQIKGGFHRKLDSHQIQLYRDDWYRIVAKQRVTESEDETIKMPNKRAEMIQLYKESRNDFALATIYNEFKNIKLRDKHIENILSKTSDPDSIIYYRSMQKRLDLIPKAIIKNEIKRLTKEKSWHNLGRLYYHIHQFEKASEYYVKSIQESIKKGNLFSTAFYIKEINELLVDELFKIELKKAKEKNDIWWQMRCLQELGLQSKIKELLIKNKKRIKKSDDIDLKREYALVTGDYKKFIKLDYEIMKREMQ